MVAKKQKLDKGFELRGVVLFLNTGENSRGEDYYMMKVGGFTFFIEKAEYKTLSEGDRVVVKGEYLSDRFNRKTQSYAPELEIHSIEVTGNQLDEADEADNVPTFGGVRRTKAAVNGVGVGVDA